MPVEIVEFYTIFLPTSSAASGSREFRWLSRDDVFAVPLPNGPFEPRSETLVRPSFSRSGNRTLRKKFSNRLSTAFAPIAHCVESTQSRSGLEVILMLSSQPRYEEDVPAKDDDSVASRLTQADTGSVFALEELDNLRSA